MHLSKMDATLIGCAMLCTGIAWMLFMAHVLFSIYTPFQSGLSVFTLILSASCTNWLSQNTVQRAKKRQLELGAKLVDYVDALSVYSKNSPQAQSAFLKHSDDAEFVRSAQGWNKVKELFQS